MRAAGGSEVSALQAELNDLMSSSQTAGKSTDAATDDDLLALRDFDTRVNTVERNLVNAKVDAARAFVSYQQSFLKPDDILGRLAIEKQSLQSNLAMLQDQLLKDQDRAYSQIRSGVPTNQDS